MLLINVEEYSRIEERIQEKNFLATTRIKLGPLGVKRERYLCAKRSPFLKNFAFNAETSLGNRRYEPFPGLSDFNIND